MKEIFVCSTPLQLINVTNIKLSQLQKNINAKSTLLILNHFKNSKQFYEKNKNVLKDLFDKVEFLEFSELNTILTNKINSSSKIKNIYNKFKIYMNRKKIISDFLYESYDKFWISSMGIIEWLFYMNCKEKNKNLELNLYEDGLGSYFILEKESPKFEKYFMKFFGLKGYLYEEMNNLYVYAPELLENNKYSNINVCKIPKIDKNNNELIEIYEKLFNLESSKILTNIIFFEQPIDSLLNEQKFIIKLLEKEIQDISVKLHPRTRYQSSEFNYIITQNIPFELFLLKTKNVPIFVTPYSSIVFNAKLMMDIEAKIVLIYKILHKDINFIKKIDRFIKKFSNLYHDKTNIIIPRNKEELVKLLKDLK